MFVFFRKLSGLVRIALSAPPHLRIFTPAFEAMDIVSFTNAVAEYYCQVAPKHFSPLAAKMGSLVVLKPEEDADRIDREKKELKEEAEAMLKHVEELMSEIKEKNDAKVNKSMAELERVFNDRVPDINQKLKEKFEHVMQIIDQLDENP